MNKGTIEEFHRFARFLPPGTPHVPVAHPAIGPIGDCIPGYGFKVVMPSRQFKALVDDEYRLALAQRSLWKKFREDFLRPRRGSIGTWDAVLYARAQGKDEDAMFTKASQTTVANNWSSFFRSGGWPATGAYTNIPNGAAMNVQSAGAFQLWDPTGGDKKYLLNFGVNHQTGTNIVLLVDLLCAAGNILLASTTNTVDSAALTRYTDGKGVMMALEVTTVLPGTTYNVTINYTNTADESHSTPTLACVNSCAVYRLMPILGGPIFPLQQGDLGVKSVQTVVFSTAAASGVVALLIYKPLVLIPTLATTAFVERSTPGMLSGIKELVTGTDGHLGCLTPFVYTSTTSTGQQTYWLQTVAG